MPSATPLATYRVQLTKDFGFDDAAKLPPYLKQLGITHLYCGGGMNDADHGRCDRLAWTDEILERAARGKEHRT